MSRPGSSNRNSQPAITPPAAQTSAQPSGPLARSGATREVNIKPSEPPKVAVTQNEQPDISVEQVQYKPPNSIELVTVQNNIMVIALAGARLIRLDLQDPDELYDIQCSKNETAKIDGVFLDPTGAHLLISVVVPSSSSSADKDSDEPQVDADLLYLHRSWTKPRSVKGSLGSEHVTAVAWDVQALTSTTAANAPVIRTVVGTGNGKLYESEVSEKDSWSDAASIYEAKWKEAHVFEENRRSVTDLRFWRFPGMQHKYYMIVLQCSPANTAMRLYNFVGPDNAASIAQLCAASFGSNGEAPNFRELPGGTSKFTWFSDLDNGKGNPTHFAWSTGAGILYGALQWGAQQPRDESVMKGAQLVVEELNTIQPVDVILSQHHIFVVFHDRIQAMSRLMPPKQQSKQQRVKSADVVWVHHFKGYPVQGVARDYLHQSLFIFSKKKLHEVTIKNETNYLWRKYLDLGRFDEALAMATQPWQQQTIYAQQSDSAFNSGNYELAAKLWGQGKSKPFDEAVGLLLQLGPQHSRALILYLTSKLGTLKYEEATQRTVLAQWILALQLQNLDRVTSAVAIRPAEKQRREEEVREITADIHQFLQQNRTALHAKTTFQQLANSGNMQLLIVYAAVVKDYSQLLQYMIQEGQWKKALAVLSQQVNSLAAEAAPLLYQYAPVLLLHAPNETVDVLMKAHEHIDPIKLLPSLMRKTDFEPPMPAAGATDAAPVAARNPILQYFEFLVSKDIADPAVHNSLLALLVRQPDEAALLRFLGTPGETKPLFSLELALNLCVKYNKRRSRVVVFAHMELFQEAVNVALTFDVALAMKAADAPRDNDIRRSLWLVIVKHLVEELHDIKGAMNCLQLCPLLTIEDVVRYLPDDSLIQDFSDEICLSLEESNRRVQDLKSQMVEAERAAHVIREDLTKLQQLTVSLPENRLCDLSHLPVKGRPHYLYPDGSCFLQSALVEEMSHVLPGEEAAHVQDLQKKINMARDTGTGKSEAVAKLQAELDHIIAREHPFYSKRFIGSLSQSFASSKGEVDSWKL